MMSSFSIFKSYAAVAVWLVLFSLSSAPATAKIQERVIYAFSDCTDSSAPLITDESGNLYGTAVDGGAYGHGCIFELSSKPDGSWSENLLYSFGGGDGGYPRESLLFDNTGSLYGTTEVGGLYDGGVIFKLSPKPDGTWTESVLYDFGNGEDGTTPQCGLIFDSAGNLYGTTASGGKHRGGTVFKLSPGPNGWTETILYEFWGQIGGPGGDVPVGGVVMDGAGNLYGVTEAGGAYGGYGAVYELSPKNGSYAERLIHSFDGYDGFGPTSGIAMDATGNLYGTTAVNISGGGTIFQLTRAGKGKWNFAVIRALDGNDGANPVGPVFIDGSGNLYAAAMSGGLVLGQGTVLMFSPKRKGSWRETVLHRFHYLNAHFKTGKDGDRPYAGVILSQGVLYGTTSSGGVNNEGTVFSITF